VFYSRDVSGLCGVEGDPALGGSLANKLAPSSLSGANVRNGKIQKGPYGERVGGISGANGIFSKP